MMTPMTKLKIKNLDELRHERFLLRSRSKALESEIKAQYSAIADQIKPALSVIKRVTNLKDTISDKFTLDTEQPALKKGLQVAKMVLPLVPVIAGNMIFNKGRKLIFQSIAGYGLAQLTRYIFSKNGSEHAESIKKVFSVNKKDA
jgi:hypothetical protein